MTEQQASSTTDNNTKPEVKDNGFVTRQELPNCPNGHQGDLVLSKSKEGFQRLHCGECHKALAVFMTPQSSLDDTEKHYAAIGPDSWGTGVTEQEAIDNMMEYADPDARPMVDIYMSNYPIDCNRYGEVVGKQEPDSVLHHKGVKHIDF
jgi:ribosomal protein S27AE